MSNIKSVAQILSGVGQQLPLPDKAFVTDKHLHDIARWYNYHKDHKWSAKQFGQSNVPDWVYAPIHGVVQLLKKKGCSFTEKTESWFTNWKADVNKRFPKQKTTTTISKSAENNDIAILENVVDTQDKKFDFYGLISNTTQKSVLEISTYYKPILDELNAIPTDAELQQAYSKDWKKTKAVVNEILKACEQVQQNKKISKKPRTPRKRKAKAFKLAEGFKFQEKDDALKLVSVHPEKIHGSKFCVLLNTKYNSVTLVSGTNLTIKGQTIQNISNAVEKRVGRNMDFVNVCKGKLIQSTILKEFAKIKATEKEGNGRIGKDTIIIRVI